jgi:hypothetical protein
MASSNGATVVVYCFAISDHHDEEKASKANKLPQNKQSKQNYQQRARRTATNNTNQNFTPKEIQNIIQEDINPRKAPGYDLIRGTILKEIPRKGVVSLPSICNSIIRTGHFPVQ